MRKPLARINTALALTAAVALAAVALVAATLAAATIAPPNLSKALEAQRQLATERPNEASVFNDLGNLLVLSSRPAEAEEAYRQALELMPAMSSARFNLALLLQQSGRNREAAVEYRRVLESDPGNAWAQYQIGSIYEAQGDSRQAIRWYGRAFALEPRLAFPEFNPSVIENRLVEQAMLLGYRDEGARPLAPKVYEDPSRIAALLVPPPPPPAAEDGVPTGEAPATEELGVDSPVAAARDQGTTGSIDPSDLDDRQVNQASPQGTGSRYGGAPAPPRVRTWSRDRAADEAAKRSQGSRGGSAPGTTVVVPGAVGQPTLTPSKAQPVPRVTTPSGRVRFRPGLPSTGRLDLELVPIGPGAPPAERAG